MGMFGLKNALRVVTLGGSSLEDKFGLLVEFFVRILSFFGFGG